MTYAASNRPDNLRDRIAAAITDGIIAGDGHGKIADAVIRELRLQRQNSFTTRSMTGRVPDGLQIAPQCWFGFPSLTDRVLYV